MTMEEQNGTKHGRVLVVDNDKSLLSAIEDYLRLCDYDVTTAATGLDALQHLRSESYDILVTDIVMPDISGIGLIEICKKEFPSLPTIAITGYGKQVKDLTIEKSPDQYLEKPFKLTELLKAMESLLGIEVR
jgi:CheY-like chemotaxis protein